MKKVKKYVFAALCMVAVIAFISGMTIAAEMTITGKINEDSRLVTDDGKTYELDANDKGLELMGIIDQDVKVVGTVQELEGENVLTVISYEVIEEAEEKEGGEGGGN